MNVEEYNQRVAKINEMSDEALDALIEAGKCPYPCELLKGVPAGMGHCPLCGEMVLYGVPHTPRWDDGSAERP